MAEAGTDPVPGMTFWVQGRLRRASLTRRLNAMKTSRNWVSGLGVTGIVLLALIICSSLWLLNGVIYRLGGIGVMAAILALAYAVIRKRA